MLFGEYRQVNIAIVPTEQCACFPISRLSVQPLLVIPENAEREGLESKDLLENMQTQVKFHRACKAASKINSPQKGSAVKKLFFFSRNKRSCEMTGKIGFRSLRNPGCAFFSSPPEFQYIWKEIHLVHGGKKAVI